MAARRAADVDFLTVGEYLQPTAKHAALDRFWTPAEFDELATLARAKGFLMVSASPLTRSSYHAGDDSTRLKAARAAHLKACPRPRYAPSRPPPRPLRSPPPFPPP